MTQIIQFYQQHQVAIDLGAYWAFSALVQTAPTPRQDQQFYGWIYNFLHVIGANLTLVGQKRPNVA